MNNNFRNYDDVWCSFMSFLQKNRVAASQFTYFCYSASCRGDDNALDTWIPILAEKDFWVGNWNTEHPLVAENQSWQGGLFQHPLHREMQLHAVWKQGTWIAIRAIVWSLSWSTHPCNKTDIQLLKYWVLKCLLQNARDMYASPNAWKKELYALSHMQKESYTFWQKKKTLCLLCIQPRFLYFFRSKEL